jgi:hypothetical protein
VEVKQERIYFSVIIEQRSRDLIFCLQDSDNSFRIILEELGLGQGAGGLNGQVVLVKLSSGYIESCWCQGLLPFEEQFRFSSWGTGEGAHRLGVPGI